MQLFRIFFFFCPFQRVVVESKPGRIIPPSFGSGFQEYENVSKKFVQLRLSFWDILTALFFPVFFKNKHFGLFLRTKGFAIFVHFKGWLSWQIISLNFGSCFQEYKKVSKTYLLNFSSKKELLLFFISNKPTATFFLNKKFPEEFFLFFGQSIRHKFCRKRAFFFFLWQYKIAFPFFF